MTCPMPKKGGRGSPPQSERAVTDRQRQVLAAILTYQTRHGHVPTARELCDLFGWASTHSAQDHVEALEVKRLLTKEEGKARTLRLTESGRDHAEGWLREHPEESAGPVKEGNGHG